MLLQRIMSLSSVVVAIATAPALADTGFYVGATAGQSRFHAHQSDFAAAADNALAADGFTNFGGRFSTSNSLDQKTHFAFGGLLGYRLAPAFSIEAAYIDLGQLHATSGVLVGPPPVQFWVSDFTVKAKGPTLAALGILPLSPAWEIYGRAGLFFARVTTQTRETLTSLDFKTTNVATPIVSSNSVDPLVGIGVAWRVTHRTALRAEYTRFVDVGDKRTIGKMNIDFYNLSVTYSLR